MTAMSERLERARRVGRKVNPHMKARARGSFVMTTRPLRNRRVHLISEVMTEWERGELNAVTALTRCKRDLASVEIHIEAPSRFELCDDCVLADYSGICVYRLFDSFGRILYIGCTKNLWGRILSHSCSRESAEWWPRVASHSYETFDSLKEALDAERLAILAERPPFNHDLTDRAKQPSRRPQAYAHLTPVTA